METIGWISVIAVILAILYFIERKIFEFTERDIIYTVLVNAVLIVIGLILLLLLSCIYVGVNEHNTKTQSTVTLYSETGEKIDSWNTEDKVISTENTFTDSDTGKEIKVKHGILVVEEKEIE